MSDPTRLLREAIERLGSEQAPQLVAEARAEAIAKARATLVDAMAESLLAHSAGALQEEAPPPRAAQRARRTGSDAPARRSGGKRSRPKPKADQRVRGSSDSPAPRDAPRP